MIHEMSNGTACRWLAYSLAVMAIGCGVSIEHGLYSEPSRDTTFDPRLLGKWVVPSDERAGYILFERKSPGANAYLMTTSVASADGEMMEFFHRQPAHLVKLGESLFLDILQPSGNDEDADHFFVKVSHLTPGRLGLRGLDVRYIREHPEAVRHVIKRTYLSLDGTPITIPLPKSRRRGEIRLTATTDELRRFLTAHADDPALWEAEDLRFVHADRGRADAKGRGE